MFQQNPELEIEELRSQILKCVKKQKEMWKNSCIAKTSCGQSIFNERKRNGCDGNTSWRKNSFGRSGDGLSTTNFVQSPWSSGA